MMRKNNQLKIYFIAFFIMVLNFMTNFLDNTNTWWFKTWDHFSETGISGPIYADHFNVPTNSWSSMGWYTGILGPMYSYEDFITDHEFENGYYRKDPIILVKNTGENKVLFAVGNYVEFQKGGDYQIINQFEKGDNLAICLQSDKPLSYKENGSLWNLKVKNSNNEYLSMGSFLPYTSHFGLQGKILRRIARLIPFEYFVFIFHLICSFFTALIFIIICYYITKRFDQLFGIIFYFVFLTGPYVVGMARNFYWCEFLIFIPLLIGIICSYYENKKIKISCIILSGVFIFIKSLCGYEFIPTIMLSLIAFPMLNFIIYLIDKNTLKAKKEFYIILFLGIFALLGFLAAFLIHTYCLGNGNLLDGLNFQKDNAIRRLLAKKLPENLDKFWGREFDAYYATRLETVLLYFNWGINIVLGVDQNLFPILCILPIIIFVFEIKNKIINVKLLILYIIMLVTSLSWVIIAKGHSYVHLHIDFIVWYFGFIQTCLYIIINFIKIHFFDKIKR